LLEVEAPRRMPHEARALYLRAAQIQGSALHQPRRAAELLERAVPLRPTDGELWTRLGKLYFGPLGEAEKGARGRARAWAADPSHVEVLPLLGNYHFDHREWEPARDYLQEALARNAVPAEQMGETRLRLAEVMRRLGDGAAEEMQL